MTTFAFIALAAFALATILGLLLEERICRQVRSTRPEVWRQLGSPERYFDDSGLARRAALARLARDPALLRQCPDDIARQVRFSRSYGRVWLAIGLLVWTGCVWFAFQ
jgi:hypothetical protein